MSSIRIFNRHSLSESIQRKTLKVIRTKGVSASRFIISLSLILSVTLCIVASGRKKHNVLSFDPPEFTVETVIENLAVPWEIVFLPDGSMLFTERPGRVRIFRKGILKKTPVLQLSDIDTTKKMGLLGLALHPAFRTNGYVYLAYNYISGSRSWLQVVRYVLQKDSLLQPLTITKNIPASQNHSGCRLKFGPDNKLYISTGDADEPAKAQDLRASNGKILRLNDDGSIPADNPFVNQPEALPEIWSYGHRNAQGIAFHPGTGRLYISEHGPNGGDEVNIVTKGGNYGWPVIHHKQSNDTMISPLLEFTPSIGPGAAIFYTSDVIPALKGHLLIACLRGEAILNIQPDGKGVADHGFLMQKQLGRLRAIVTGPDGYLYLSTSQKDPPEGKPGPGDDKIMRLIPVKSKIAGKASDANKPVQKNVVSRLSAPANQTEKLFQELCMNCHGPRLTGSQWARPITSSTWQHGGSIEQVIYSITKGYPQKGMPSWEGAISAKDINDLGAYVIRLAKNKKEK